MFAISSDNQGGTVVNFPLSSIISALSGVSCGSSKVTSLANQIFYLRSVLTNVGPQYGGCLYSTLPLGAEANLSSSDPIGYVTAGCSTNPDFEQWANVSCDSACVCSIQASGRFGTNGGNQIVGAGPGCQGYWQVQNGWGTGSNYQQIALFGMAVAGGIPL